MSIHELPVPGARLFIETRGSDAAEPLVLLHGGPAAGARYLQPYCDALAQGSPGRRLIYYDQRGSERSPLDADSAPAGYERQVEDLEAVRTWLGVSRLTLGGYSWGGLLALLYALAHPDRVERLLLISPAPTYAAARAEYQRRFVAAGQRPQVQALRRELLEPPPADPEQARQYRFALAVSGYFVDPRRALELTPFRIPQRVEQAIWQSLGGYDLRSQLSSLRHIPALVIHGEDDIIPVATAAETAELLGAQFVRLADCGHVPYVEAAPALFGAAREFLGSSSATAS